MSDTQLTAPQILAKAADILDTQGWTQNGDYHHYPHQPVEDSPVNLAAALALAAGVDMHSYFALHPIGVHAKAVMTLGRVVLGRDLGLSSAGRILDELTEWQDEPGRTVEEVTEKLRTAMDDQVRALLRAIHDAIDLPPAVTSEGDSVRDRLLDRRALSLAASLETLLKHGDLSASAEIIRENIAAKPITYTVAPDPDETPLVYPAPGSAIPDMPGYVVGECTHRVAASEWRVGFRTCERCNFGGQTGGAL